MPYSLPPMGVTRRRLLFSSLALAPLAVMPGLARATPALASVAEPAARRLAFYHTHTSETLRVTYKENGAFLPEALAEIGHLCRDFRTGDLHPIDPALLDLLHDVQLSTGGGQGRFEIISAYRSPTTNEMLASRSNGVATGSLHLRGRAMDLRLPGVRLTDLRNAALARAGGGVGYYPGSDFVHMDTGRVRRW